MSTNDHVVWGGGSIFLEDGSVIHWTPVTGADAKRCRVTTPDWRGYMLISALEEELAGNLTAAVMTRLRNMNAVTEDTLTEIVGEFAPTPDAAPTIYPGYSYLKPAEAEAFSYDEFEPKPVTIFERTDEEMARDTKPFDSSKPIKRIDKIGRY